MKSENDISDFVWGWWKLTFKFVVVSGCLYHKSIQLKMWYHNVNLCCVEKFSVDHISFHRVTEAFSWLMKYSLTGSCDQLGLGSGEK